MIRGVVTSSLRLRALVVAVALAVVFLGVTQLRSMPVDVLPEYMPTTVQIQTDALGLSADEVEQLITVPLEQDLLNGLPWLDQIRSDSMPGLSSVDLVFKRGTDVLHARQMVQERLSQAHALPQVGTPPVMIQPLSSTSRVLMIGLSTKNLSPVEMSLLARWKIRPRLMGLPGVANVALWGQRDRQLQVQVDPARLRRYGVQLNQVIDSTGNALWVSPLTFVEASTPGTGGFIDTPNQRFSVQHVLPITTAKSLAAVTLEGGQGKIMRLGDVAHVTEDHQPLIGDAVVDGGPGLVMVVQKFPEANTREVTQAVENALHAMAPGLTGISIDTTVYRPATFIDSALHNLGRAALVSLVLVVLLVGFLLLSWRAALVALATIPVSLIAAAYVLYLSGATFNVMVAVGLVAALGAVVDDVVVGVLGVQDRLRHNRKPGAEQPSATSTVLEATLGVRSALVYATVITLLAALPVFLLGGITGSFSRPLLASYALAVVASLLVALTLGPALTVLLFSREGPVSRRSPLTVLVGRGLRQAVPRYVARPRWAYATVGLLTVAGLVVGTQVGSQAVLPQAQDRDVLVHWDAAPGTSLPEMTRVTTSASRALRDIPGIRDVGAHVGRAITSDQVVDVNSAELWASISGSADYGATMSAIRRVVNSYPGLRHDLMTYPADQVRQFRTDTSNRLTVRVYGLETPELADKGQEIRRAISQVKGVVAPTVESPVVGPAMQVKVDLSAAERHGIKPGDVRRAAAALLSGIQVGNLYEDQKVFDVVVLGSTVVRHSPTSVQDLVIDTPTGGHVRLGDVAAVDVRPGLADIKRNSSSRSLDVTADVRGRDVGAVVRDIKARIAAMSMPLEYHAEVVNAPARQQNDARHTLAVSLAVALMILLLLQAAFTSWRFALLVFLTLPLAAVGGILVAPLVGGVGTVGAAAGIFAVLAVALRNVVVLVRRCQRMEPDAGHTEAGYTEAELVLRATRDTAPAVVLTALTTAVAVLPFVLFGHVAGTEALFPMAVVVLGGLVTSTVLTLLVVPALYLRLAPAARAGRQGSPGPADPAPLPV
jgi:Cu/Ag efflux pump CusA